MPETHVRDRTDPMNQAVGPDAAERSRRLRHRNLAVLVALLGLAALFYVITLVRMGGGG